MKFNELFKRFSDRQKPEQPDHGQGKKDSSYQTSAIIFFGSILSIIILLIILAIEQYFG